jgi:sialic acid synthase SpsE
MVSDHTSYNTVKNWLLTRDEWKEIITLAHSLKLDIIALADDLAGLEFLKSLENNLAGIEIHAVSLNDVHMMEKAACFNIPVFLGIGGSTIEEISFAVDYLKNKGKLEIVLMYGFQNFPTKYEYINLKKMKKIQELFKLPIGYADHTSWDNDAWELITLAGFLCGANIIEKHFVLEKGVKRIDFEAAVSTKEFKSLYKKLIVLQKALGNGRFELNQYEKEYAKIGPMKKAIVAERDISKDEVISLQNIAFKRTKKVGTISQRELENLLKRKASHKIKKNEFITFKNTYL